MVIFDFHKTTCFSGESEVLKILYTMRKNYLMLLIVLALGCKQNKEQHDSATSEDEMPAIEFVGKSLTEKDFPECETEDCPEITINYLEVNDSEFSEGINKKIEDFVIASFQISEAYPQTNSVENAAENFIASYKDDVAQFPEIAGRYVVQIDVKEIYRSPGIISLELRQYLYTGGAHGNGTTTFLNVDQSNGKTLNLNDLFEDQKEFEEFAKKQFYQKHGIPENESVNSTGFWFENDTFYLPETVGFTLDDLVFIYNNYEITSYADNPVEFRISKSDANQFLKPQYNIK